MKLNQLVRKLKLDEALSPEFRRFCHLASIARAHRTTPRMLFLVGKQDVAEFHSLLKRFKHPDMKIRRFARGTRTHRSWPSRPTSALVANAHSFAYYLG